MLPIATRTCIFGTRFGSSFAASVSASRYFAVVSATASGQKKTFKRDKMHINIGTIGHVDHGKTTLTSAITKVLSEAKKAKFAKYEDIDNAPQERERGITINATHVEYETDSNHYGHVDCPGHADYIKNMITGTNQMDAAILVVAASEGCMPQTREHLLLSKQIGIKDMIVFINKVDECDSDTVELVESEVSELLEEYGFDPATTPIVKGSALCALENIKPEIGKDAVMELLSACDTKLKEPERPLDKPFKLAVEHVYSIKGRGTVVSGRLETGKIRKGDAVEFVGYANNITSVVSSLETYHKILDEAHAGDQCGILIRGVKREELRRGLVMVPKDSKFPTTDTIEAKIYVLTEDEGGSSTPLVQYSTHQMFSKTWDTGGYLSLGDKDMLMPGEDGTVNFIMQTSGRFVEPQQRFTLRSMGKTVATGMITKLMDPTPIKDKEWSVRRRVMKRMVEKLGFNPYASPEQKRAEEEAKATAA